MTGRARSTPRASPAVTSMSEISAQIAEMFADAERCAAAAGLVHVSDEEAGIRRRRHGRGFAYRDERGRPLTNQAVKARILDLAVPPAWCNVWICSDPDGHILAVGEDDRGRKQYLYHERWRELRDLLNFYRLIAFAERLPRVRRHVAAQLRRRTLDRDQVLATMVRIIDTTGIRIGNEVYAEENDSFGLSTLTRKHVGVDRATVRLSFPAKSGKRADVEIRDSRVARVIEKLANQRTRRLFTVDRSTVDASEVNDLLFALTGEHITAKDFRTWRGTLIAFTKLVETAGLRRR